MHSPRILYNVDNLLKDKNESDSTKTIALSVANFSTMFLGIVLQILLTRYLTKYELSAFMQSMMVYNTVYPFFQFGLTSSLMYFLTRNDGYRKKTMHEAFSIACIGGLLWCTFLMLGGGKFLSNLFNNSVLQYTSIFILPFLLITIIESYVIVGLVYYNKVRFVAVYSAIKSLMTVIILVAIVCFFHSGSILFFGRVLLCLLFGCWVIYLFYTKVMEQDCGGISISGIREIFSFSIPLGLASMAGVLSSNLDKWIISSMYSPEVFAVFQIGAYELPFISVLTGAITTVKTAGMTKAVNDGDNDLAMALFYDIAKKTSAYLLPCMFYFFMVSKQFITILFTEEYIDATPIFCVYLLYIPARCVIYGPLFVAFGKTKYVMVREVIAVILNLGVSVLLVRYLGSIGAAVATVLVVYLFSIPYNIYGLSKLSKKKWHIILPFRWMGKCLFICTLCASLIYLCEMSLFFSHDLVMHLFELTVIYTSSMFFLYKIILRINILNYYKIDL